MNLPARALVIALLGLSLGACGSDDDASSVNSNPDGSGEQARSAQNNQPGPVSVTAVRIPQQQAGFGLLSNRAVYLRTPMVEIPPGTTRFEIGTCPKMLLPRTAAPLGRFKGNPESSFPKFDLRSGTFTYEVSNTAASSIERQFVVACAPRSSFDDS